MNTGLARAPNERVQDPFNTKTTTVFTGTVAAADNYSMP
jgi:hypothetical protein